MLENRWSRCTDYLRLELSEQQFNTWIRPLTPVVLGQSLCLLAPNKFIQNWVEQKFLVRINELMTDLAGSPFKVCMKVGRGGSSCAGKSASDHQHKELSMPSSESALADGENESIDSFLVENNNRPESKSFNIIDIEARSGNQSWSNMSGQDNWSNSAVTDGSFPVRKRSESALNSWFTFESFVEGKSNQLALAATKQVVENPGSGYNPLFIYGGVGLGKTHLMHAIGNELKRRNSSAKVVYLHSERFVADMVKALQLNAINDFKNYYRGVDALLIDDIQFFAKKDRSQEEFFHTFNSLMEGGQQMIFTCDRYPKEIDGLEERLKSRFGWGLTAAVEPPELETRAAILMKKAERANIFLPQDAAFFIAQRIRSNVRELEGALKRVIASAQFTGEPISLGLIKESLKDLLALQERLVTIDNIQRVVAEYYKIKLTNLLSKKRTRSLARPRQLAMSLAKELTNHSLPEIGEAFGGRDHTTVLHACRKIHDLEASSADLREDLKNLNRILST